MIYCVEDDKSIRELEVYALESAGFKATGFSDSSDLWKALDTELPELILLDIMLPGEDGMEILKKIKSNRKTADIPVIMATAKGTEYDKVLGLDTGADDYLVKPFGMLEMISHIKAVLRRTSSRVEKKSDVITFDRLSIAPNEHIVKVDDIDIQLTLKEYDMLLLFVKNIGKAFSRDELLSRIWEASSDIETRTVDVHIGTLRTKLGECGSYIQTVRGVGYRFGG